jgi:uncharacterized protein YhbP (UPF0306 family)
MSSDEIQSLEATLLTQQPAVFDLIVKDDSDIIGLLAYSLHELSHREWHKSFIAHFSREPNVTEITAFMIGEATLHRIAVYRRLAENALNMREQGKSISAVEPIQIKSNIPPVMSQNSEFSHKFQIKESNLAKGIRAALRLPPDTNLKNLGKSLVLLFVLVSLLAIIVNYAKRMFF